jgi:ketosteroid isomerase-like protein
MAQAVNTDDASIRALFGRYTELLNANDADSISTAIYRPPVLAMGTSGTHSVIPTQAAFAQAWKSYLEGRRKAGVETFQLDGVEVCSLSGNAAFAIVGYTTKMIDGTAAKAAWIYVMQKEAGEWRAVGVTPRDPGMRMACAMTK